MASSASCHRARRRPATPPSQLGIWITDLMLQQAIGQWQRRSLVTNRPLSSHNVLSKSGRRPLGKRQLTDALASSQHQPLWWFELMGNKNAWQWQPPSAPQDRREKEKHVTWASSLDKIVAWLEASDLDKPFLDPPADATKTTTSKAIEATDTVDTIDSTDALGATAQQTQAHASQIPETLLSYVEVLGRASDQHALDTAVQACCEALEYRILSAQFTEFEMEAVLTALDSSALKSPLKKLIGVKKRITKTIICAVCSLCPQQSSVHEVENTVGELYAKSMGAILRRIYAGSGEVKGHMYTQLLESLQPHDTFVSSILQRIAQNAVEECASRHFGTHGAIRIERSSTSQLIGLSDALCQQPEHMRQKIAAHMKEFVSRIETPRSHAFAWLFIATRGDFYRPEESAQLFMDFSELHGGKLSDSELSSLLLERLVRIQALDEKQRLSLVSQAGHTEYLPFFWITFLETLDCDTRNGIWVLREVMAWLSDRDQRRRLCWAVTIAQLSHDEHLRERARDIMGVCLAADVMHPGELQRVVSKASRWLRSYAHLRRQLGDPEEEMSADVDWKRTPYLIENIASYWATSKSTARYAQKRIEWCLTQSELCSNSHLGSDRILQSLIEVLIRGLQEGQPIPKARQLWLLRKIEQYQGVEPAEKVQKQLEHWAKHITAYERIKATRLPMS